MNLISTLSADNVICPGRFIHPFSFCQKHAADGKCAAFYESLRNQKKNTFYTCPYGLSSYITSNDIVFTCMRERKTYDKKKSKFFSDAEPHVFNPVYNAAQLISIIDNYVSIVEKEAFLEGKRASIDSISHEVKQLNTSIKDNSDIILQTYQLGEDTTYLSLEDRKEINERIKSIYVSSSMIAGRFSLYDFEKNPAALSNGAEFSCDIYKKFDKIRRIFKNYKKKGVQIKLEGSTYRSFTAYPSFELIPLLLIENAVKYSMNGNEVVIKFVEQGSSTLKVSINSYSPYCSADEISHLLEKGFRGKHAKRISDGSGIGLYYVKILCDLHNISLNIVSDNTKIVDMSGIAYAPFKAELIFFNTHEDSYNS